MRRPALSALVLFALAAAEASACSIPVFRYAFENWKPAAYEVIIFRRGPLDQAQRRAVDRLRDAKDSNLAVINVDLDAKPDAKWLKVHGKLLANTKQPILALRQPDSDAKSSVVWSGPVNDASVTNLLDSPARQAIVRQLGSGYTAVFLLLESGDKQKDDAAAKLLGEERVRLEKETVLPELTKEGPQPRSKLPLKVVFPIVRMSRTEPAEAAMVQMLLHGEPGLEKETGPIVFPIYGRGRLLAALHGDDVSAEELERVAEFLCKACSCQVKELNPGVDLLFTADWEALVTADLPPAEAAEKDTTIKVTSLDSPPAPPASRSNEMLFLKQVIIPAMGVIPLMAVAWFVVMIVRDAARVRARRRERRFTFDEPDDAAI